MVLVAFTFIDLSTYVYLDFPKLHRNLEVMVYFETNRLEGKILLLIFIFF